MFSLTEYFYLLHEYIGPLALVVIINDLDDCAGNIYPE